MASGGKRTGNKLWKHIYGVDRAYTRRKDAADERLAAHVCGPSCRKNRPKSSTSWDVVVGGQSADTSAFPQGSQSRRFDAAATVPYVYAPKEAAD